MVLTGCVSPLSLRRCLAPIIECHHGSPAPQEHKQARQQQQAAEMQGRGAGRQAPATVREKRYVFGATMYVDVQPEAATSSRRGKQQQQQENSSADAGSGQSSSFRRNTTISSGSGVADEGGGPTAPMGFAEPRPPALSSRRVAASPPARMSCPGGTPPASRFAGVPHLLVGPSALGAESRAAPGPPPQSSGGGPGPTSPALPRPRMRSSCSGSIGRPSSALPCSARFTCGGGAMAVAAAGCIGGPVKLQWQAPNSYIERDEGGALTSMQLPAASPASAGAAACPAPLLQRQQRPGTSRLQPSQGVGRAARSSTGAEGRVGVGRLSACGARQKRAGDPAHPLVGDTSACRTAEGDDSLLTGCSAADALEAALRAALAPKPGRRDAAAALPGAVGVPSYKSWQTPASLAAAAGSGVQPRGERAAREGSHHAGITTSFAVHKVRCLGSCASLCAPVTC
jgi:hypothetical protein